MPEITVVRTDYPMPDERGMVYVRQFLTECIRGVTEVDRKAWNRFWNAWKRKEPGEMAELDLVFPRSGPFHRRHMKIEQSVFDAQERFEDFKQFRYWLKVGAAWVTWAAGPAGGVVPIPKSISYAKADELEFREYHDKVIRFLRGPHAARYLWKHLGDAGAHEMMECILQGFEQ